MSWNRPLPATRPSLDQFNEDTDRANKFLALAKKYTDFSELTAPMINEFVEKIVVHAPRPQHRRTYPGD